MMIVVFGRNATKVNVESSPSVAVVTCKDPLELTSSSIQQRPTRSSMSFLLSIYSFAKHVLLLCHNRHQGQSPLRT
jgi:hypothetical protein